MKKIILLAAILLAGTGAYAQSAQYQGEIAAGYSVGVGTWSIDRFTIETVHGARLNPHFFVGAGLGLHAYSDNGGSMIPIFANAKGYLFDKDTTPFASVDIGYGVGVGDNSGVGGFYISPSVGVSFRVGGTRAVNFGVGYQSQSLSESGVSISMNAISFKLGFTF